MFFFFFFSYFTIGCGVETWRHSCVASANTTIPAKASLIIVCEFLNHTLPCSRSHRLLLYLIPADGSRESLRRLTFLSVQLGVFLRFCPRQRSVTRFGWRIQLITAPPAPLLRACLPLRCRQSHLTPPLGPAPSTSTLLRDPKENSSTTEAGFLLPTTPPFWLTNIFCI